MVISETHTPQLLLHKTPNTMSLEIGANFNASNFDFNGIIDQRILKIESPWSSTKESTYKVSCGACTF
jgi:hypothetical protein